MLIVVLNILNVKDKNTTASSYDVSSSLSTLKSFNEMGGRCLTHSFLMHPFSTPWKGALGTNGLKGQ